jgi:hypothetical protein
MLQNQNGLFFEAE